MHKISKSGKSFSSFSFSLYYTFFVAAYRGACRTWLNIYNGAFLRKYLTVLTSQMFEWVESRLLAKVLNIELTFVPNLQIKPKKCSARKYVWHRIWKGERS